MANNSAPVYPDGVRMTDIVEGTVGALHYLAKDPHNRNLLRQPHVIPILVSLLTSNVEQIQVNCLSIDSLTFFHAVSNHSPKKCSCFSFSVMLPVY